MIYSKYFLLIAIERNSANTIVHFTQNQRVDFQFEVLHGQLFR